MVSKYIHYGSTEFDESKFQPIKNKEISVKPEGGLWGSPLGCRFGWKEWNDSSNYSECSKDNAFIFRLSDDANVMQIKSVSDLDALPKAESIIPSFSAWVVLDFEELLRTGVDAIVLNMSEEVPKSATDSLYFKLYGWDCDSILVMNKDVILPCPAEEN